MGCFSLKTDAVTWRKCRTVEREVLEVLQRLSQVYVSQDIFPSELTIGFQMYPCEVPSVQGTRGIQPITICGTISVLFFYVYLLKWAYISPLKYLWRFYLCEARFEVLPKPKLLWRKSACCRVLWFVYI